MAKPKTDVNSLSFFGHLRELKNRVLVLLGFFAVLFCVMLYKVDAIMDFLLVLGKNVGYTLVYISPEEVIVQQLRIAAIAALLVMIPLFMYEITAFISPAVTHKNSLLNILLFLVIGLVMFVVGALFAAKVMLPFSLKYFKDIGDQIHIEAQISLQKYLNFIIAMTLAIGVSFDFPVVCLTLNFAGLINEQMLKKARPWIVVVIFIVAAVITPPDVLTQFMVTIPLCALFEASIVLINIAGKRKKKAERIAVQKGVQKNEQKRN